MRSAEASSTASAQEARAARADRLPQITAGVDAGRYGVIENDRDYDIRGRVGAALPDLRHRRRPRRAVRGPRARRRGPRHRASARRPSATPPSPGRTCARCRSSWTRSKPPTSPAAAPATSIVERFRVARGTLFDVVAAEDAYFESATAYIQALSELDAARYVLLSRMGRLLDILEVDPDRLRGEG